MATEAYRNLRSKVWSLRENGRVVAHAKTAWFKMADLVVHEAGRARARRERQKNVHALIRGEFIGFNPQSDRAMAARLSDFDRMGWARITYTPYGDLAAFTRVDNGEIVRSAMMVYLHSDGKAYAYEPSPQKWT